MHSGELSHHKRESTVRAEEDTVTTPQHLDDVSVLFVLDRWVTKSFMRD